ncbi:MAG: hypothetical protein R6U01_05580 [Halorubrum sp.]|uniref:hypothetical protein n=1 Tax=Halorubrum sp. TaxID=1879286 RepID=UPI0039706C56
MQMTAVGSLGLLVAWAFFAGPHEAATGALVSLRFAPATLGWIATPTDVVAVGALVELTYALLWAYRRSRAPIAGPPSADPP